MHCDVEISKDAAIVVNSKSAGYLDRCVKMVAKTRGIPGHFTPGSIQFLANGTIVAELYVGHHSQQVRDVDFISYLGKEINKNALKGKVIISRISPWRYSLI